MGNSRRQGRRGGRPGSVKPLRANATPAEAIEWLDGQRLPMIAGLEQSIRNVREIEHLQAQWRARAAGESEDIDPGEPSDELRAAIDRALSADPT